MAEGPNFVPPQRKSPDNFIKGPMSHRPGITRYQRPPIWKTIKPKRGKNMTTDRDERNKVEA